MSEISGDIGPRDEGYHPRVDQNKIPINDATDKVNEEQILDSSIDAKKIGLIRGFIDRFKSSGSKASEVLIPKDKCFSAEEITEQDVAKYIQGYGEASPASPGLLLTQFESHYGYTKIPDKDSPEFQTYVGAKRKIVDITSELVLDGTLILKEEKQPSGDTLTTYAINNPTKLQEHTRIPQPVRQAHPAYQDSAK